MGEFAIGQSVSRFEDPRLLRGGGRYVGDIMLPGMTFGYVLRSPHAHARIRSIDTSRAKAAPGVLAVLTGADWQASGWGDLPVPGGLKRRDGTSFRPPYPALVKDRVRFAGDYVAFVVAETLLQAHDAAELITVDYEPLPAVVSTGEATAGGAARVWDQCPDNIGFVQLFGDKAATDAAFAKADHIIKHHFVINRVTAASMEPRGSVGDYNAAEERYTVYTTLQRTHPFRAELAPILKVPESKIRVIAGDIGGSFGMKSAVYNEVAHFNDKDYYTDEQLESAKALLEADDLYSREKFDEYAKTLGFWWSSTGIDYFRGYLGNLRRTSRADISRYVTTYIQGKSHVSLALISEQAQQQAKLTPEDLIGR